MSIPKSWNFVNRLG